jgi:Rieske [2Fe-2S] domain
MSRAQDRDARVGPGTLMGEFMRQCWIPAALSSELAADGDPMRLLLLGEELIAFRDTAERVGVLDQRCPHGTVKLALAGLRRLIGSGTQRHEPVRTFRLCRLSASARDHQPRRMALLPLPASAEEAEPPAGPGAAEQSTPSPATASESAMTRSRQAPISSCGIPPSPASG